MKEPRTGQMATYLFLATFFIMNSQITEVEAADRYAGRSFATRSEVIGMHGMAATSQPLAVNVALDILKSGGNAVDAAIAANAVMGLVEPTGNGIGGDLFAIVWDGENKKLHGLNASGRSPRNLTLEYFKNEKMDFVPDFGPLPVTVPGCVDGWFELHTKFGSKPMTELLQPAVNYATEGFPVSEVIAKGWQNSVPVFEKFPGFKETYLINGKAPEKGQIFKNPTLARTLSIIAREGRDGFYKGYVAETIEKYIKAQGGFLTAEDLANHKSEWVDPVSVNYRGYDIWELPPNTQGIAALQMLQILEGFDIRAMGFGSPQYIHHFIEAKKLAFADRAHFYADMQMADVPLDELLSSAYARQRRKLIDPYKAADQVDHGDPILAKGDTIYLTTADKMGNMVSLIQSNYMGFGSGMTPPELGFMIQNRGQLFKLEEGHANTYAPGKRPFHTIIPAFITRDGKPWVSFGVMGGDMQPQGHVQIVVNLIDFDMNLQEAGDAPRIRHAGSSSPTGKYMTDGGTVYLESGYPTHVIEELQKMGHKISNSSTTYGGYQAIMRDPESKALYGASESRKDGMASGF